MIPDIAIIITTYAIARLALEWTVPTPGERPTHLRALIAISVLIIGAMCISVIGAGASVSTAIR